jgi:hypothetical protein
MSDNDLNEKIYDIIENDLDDFLREKGIPEKSIIDAKLEMIHVLIDEL